MTESGVSRSELRAAGVFGLLIAITIDLGWLFTLWPHTAANPWRWPIAALTCVIQTVVTTAGVVGAAW
ncbi:MAG: hypothetical protein QMD53_06750, partial [Actinomycetota bacterium]|nr:hypothetical protein [Actinomycetota bacterium]